MEYEEFNLLVLALCPAKHFYDLHICLMYMSI